MQMIVGKMSSEEVWWLNW